MAIEIDLSIYFCLTVLVQGIIDPTGTETFAKEPKFANLLWELKVDLMPFN